MGLAQGLLQGSEESRLEEVELVGGLQQLIVLFLDLLDMRGSLTSICTLKEERVHSVISSSKLWRLIREKCCLRRLLKISS